MSLLSAVLAPLFAATFTVGVVSGRPGQPPLSCSREMPAEQRELVARHISQDIAARVNAYRMSRGIPPIVGDLAANADAENWPKRLANVGEFAHSSETRGENIGSMPASAAPSTRGSFVEM